MAKERFREIAEAYEVLSEERKRGEYGGFGFEERKPRNQRKYNYEDADSLFKNVFKEAGFDTKED